MLTEQQIEEIMAREQALDPETWDIAMHNEVYEMNYGETTHFVRMGNELFKIGCDSGNDDKNRRFRAITAFIAHAREDIPELLAELERLQKELKEVKNKG